MEPLICAFSSKWSDLARIFLAVERYIYAVQRRTTHSLIYQEITTSHKEGLSAEMIGSPGNTLC